MICAEGPGLRKACDCFNALFCCLKSLVIFQEGTLLFHFADYGASSTQRVDVPKSEVYVMLILEWPSLGYPIKKDQIFPKKNLFDNWAKVNVLFTFVWCQ